MRKSKEDTMTVIDERAKAARKMVVTFRYRRLEDVKKPKKINKKRFLYLANEVGKHWTDDDPVPSNTTSARS